MDSFIYAFKLMGVLVGGVVSLTLLWMCWYLLWGKEWLDYREARAEITEFVKGYKHRCNGSNRFVVTVQALQDSFREYDTVTVERVWRDLVKNHIIQQDPMDNEWCIR